jgi:hypothetical protein
MAKILDDYAAFTIADALDEVFDDLGFGPDEAIPGMVASIRRMAGRLADTDEALDEAANLLADGF